MRSDEFRDALCKAFCGDLTVVEVPSGLAISATFEHGDGDRLGCLVEHCGLTWRVSDDGSFLGDLDAYGIDLRNGSRAEFLRRTLLPAGARVDAETLQMVAEFEEFPDPHQVITFLSSVARAQDVAFWTRERVRSTFKEDATAAIKAALGENATSETNTPIDASLHEFPCDVVVRPKVATAGNAVTAVYLVQTLDHLTEAMVLALELRTRQRRDVRVTAVIEDGSLNISGFKAQRSINRIDTFAFFRNDETAAVDKVVRTAMPEAHLLN